MPPSRASAGEPVEWVGGLESLQSTLDDQDGVYHPEILLWLLPSGRVVEFRLGPPGTLLEHAAEHLHDALEGAQRDGATRPESVRVRSAELAAQLRASALPLPPITCAPTPEVEAVVADMASRLAQDEPSRLSVDIEPKHVAAFFAAAARLHRAEPWRFLPSEVHAVSIDIDALGVHDAVVSLVGQTPAQFALVLFPHVDAFHTFLHSPPGAVMPAHTSFSFVPTSTLHRALAEEIELWGWELASTTAAPEVVVVDAGQVTRDATHAELTILEATLLALARGCADGTLTDEACHVVASSAGSFEVRVRPSKAVRKTLRKPR